KVRGELSRYGDAISPSNRTAWMKLVDGADDTPPASAMAAPVAALVEPLALDDESRGLGAVQDLDELVRLIAHVFENDEDIDAFERALCGLVLACPVQPGDLSRFRPV